MTKHTHEPLPAEGPELVTVMVPRTSRIEKHKSETTGKECMKVTINGKTTEIPFNEQIQVPADVAEVAKTYAKSCV